MLTIDPSICMSAETVAAVHAFCMYAFSQTKYLNTRVIFAPFDATNTYKAAVSVDEEDLIVNFNIAPEDTLDDMFEILAHESIHAKQMSEGRLSYMLVRTENGLEWGFNWEGNPYRAPVDIEGVLALPWEIEAYEGTNAVVELYHIMQKSLIPQAVPEAVVFVQ